MHQSTSRWDRSSGPSWRWVSVYGLNNIPIWNTAGSFLIVVVGTQQPTSLPTYSILSFLTRSYLSSFLTRSYLSSFLDLIFNLSETYSCINTLCLINSRLSTRKLTPIHITLKPFRPTRSLELGHPTTYIYWITSFLLFEFTLVSLLNQRSY